MKKIALQLLVLVMALVVSQAVWADGKDKVHGGRPGWGATHQNGQHKGFDQAKWDSLLAAHPNLAHRMDSIKAHRPDPRHFGHKNDTAKVHRPMGHGFDKARFDSIMASHSNFGHKNDSVRGHRPMRRPQFGRRPMPMHPNFGFHRFGPHRFGPRHPWMHRHHSEEVTTAETVVEEAKANDMDATAITETRQATTVPTYDLNGRKVTTQQGGVVIRNGRKYVR